MSQLTNTILMVRPVDFSFNEQTAVDNEFQHKPQENLVVNAQAMQEFEGAVSTLKQAGVNVLVLEKTADPNSEKMPDAVFPNNWISTDQEGNVVVYPMAAPNRRAERRRLLDVEKLFLDHQYTVKNIIQVGPTHENSKFLEGTGSMVIDRVNKIVYAALSVRTHPEQLQNFVDLLGYKKAVAFETRSSKGVEFYHTNVMMSVAKDFAVVCLASVHKDEERQVLVETLSQTHEVIDITLDQAEQCFCGNVLQVKDAHGTPVTVMSASAYKGFTKDQIAVMEKYGKVLPISIPTIEFVGGGSARCMMAEVFLPPLQVQQTSN